MSVTIDQQFIEYIVKAIVSNSDAVKVDRSVDEKGVLLELTVDPEDIGRVIGKRGTTAQSLRALLRALGTKNDARYNLKIVDIDRPEGERGSRYQKPAEGGSIDGIVEKVEEAPRDEDGDNFLDEPVDKGSDLAKKTRAELADLDDLDI